MNQLHNNPHFKIPKEKTMQHVTNPGRYAFLSTIMDIHLSTKQSIGGYSIIEAFMQSGTESFSHLHCTEDETIHLLEGEVRVNVGSAIIVLSPGQSLFIPRNTPHNIVNSENETARMFLFYSGASFAELVGVTGQPADSFGTIATPIISETDKMPYLAKKSGLIYLNGPAQLS
ncbi:cupin domain-containing protein [Pedobacter sp. ISL-68]|uniref:cupin domain-containing protein n=1 Tax=unclassified Pedobacter TaxID=2628915 RepID=UPI001BEC36C6|nr:MULTISPECIES: cupin domain-containing protein [unclassified Pedobacter]MBT2560216.1 cupin domain-containing protein [Pedobacter sp. ISL-64]MBT2589196.1 cupin domain-containing protein [Pedobacter sp. ISL-68]